jgi:hypothetical protein
LICYENMHYWFGARIFDTTGPTWPRIDLSALFMMHRRDVDGIFVSAFLVYTFGFETWNSPMGYSTQSDILTAVLALAF